MPTIPNIDINPPKYGTNFAAELYKMITDVPKMYQEGAEGAFKRAQYAHTEALQKPLVGPDGQPLTDPVEIAQELARRAPEKAPELLPFMWKAGYTTEPTAPSPYAGAPAQPADSRGAETFGQSGDNLRGAAARQSAAGIPSGGDPRGPTNLRQILLDNDIDPNDPNFRDVISEQFAGLGQQGIDRLLHPKAAEAAVNKLENLRGAGLFGANVPPITLRGQPATFSQRFTGQPPTTGQPGPAPAAAPAGPAMASRPGAAPPSVSALVPPGWRGREREYAQSLQLAADAQYKIAQRKALRGIPAGADEAQAKGYLQAADKVLDELRETERQRDPSAKIMELNVAENEKRKAAIFDAGEAAENSLPQLALARRVVSSPGFNSGLGHQFFDTVQSLSQQMFGGTALTSPGEFYDKLRSGGALNKLTELKNGGIGALRVPEMKMVDKIVADRNVQAPGIRAATEVELRLQKRLADTYHEAQTYLETHRQLDDGFKVHMSRWREDPKNHLFSKEELTHPELLSRPVFASPEEMRASRMPRGTPFRTPDGGHGVIP